MLGVGERHVMLLTVTVETVPKQGPDKSYSDIISVLNSLEIGTVAPEQALEAEELNEHDGDVDDRPDPSPLGTVLSLSDIRELNGITTLLVNLADTKAPDPVFLNVGAKKTRAAKKRNGEGLGQSAHLCIIAPKDPKSDFTCSAVLEKAPFLSKSVIFKYINQRLRAHCKDNGSFTFVDEAGREKKFRLRLVADAKPSHKLKADLEAGTLSTIELRQKKVDQEFDEADKIITKAKSINFKVDRTAIDFKDVLSKVLKWGNEKGYDEISLKFKSAKGRERSFPKFSTSIQAAEELVYAQHEIIGPFYPPISHCVLNISTEIESALVALLRDQTLWVT